MRGRARTRGGRCDGDKGRHHHRRYLCRRGIVPCRPAVPRHPGQRQARLPARGPRADVRAGRARVAELSEAYASAGYGLGHRVATLLENRPEHVLHTLALNGDRRLLRADQSGLPGGRDRLPPRAQQARSGADALLPRGASARGPGAERAQAAGGAVGARAGARCRKRRGQPPARRRRPRRRPASSTPPAPPDGRRAASSRMATWSRWGRGMPRSGAWQRCARARSASTIRCRSITPTPASCR